MAFLWKEILNKIKPYEPGKPIEEVQRELGLSYVIKLASNENPFPPSKKVMRAIADGSSDINRYPDGNCFYLRKTLSDKLSLDERNIVFGNGSDELIVLALRAFIKPGDEVITADPTFLIYSIAAAIEGAKVKTVPMKNLRYDLDAMAKKINKRTKIIFIANPDNPTGSYVSNKELKKFVKTIPKNVILFIDEAYYEFASGDDYPETLSWAGRKDKNIIITRKFSKAYALAGLRIGYGISRADIIAAMNKVREPFNINSLAQIAAIAAIEDISYMEKIVSFIRSEKERFYEFFSKSKIEYYPSLTNFILFRAKKNSKEEFMDLLREGVIVREMSAWHLNNFLRVNVGTKKENNRFFEVYQKITLGEGK